MLNKIKFDYRREVRLKSIRDVRCLSRLFVTTTSFHIMTIFSENYRTILSNDPNGNGASIFSHLGVEVDF